MIDWLLTIAGVADVGLLQGLVFAGVAFSVVLSLLSLDFPDLSIEGTFPLGAAVAAVCLTRGVPVPLAFLAAALAGAFGGLLTGTLHVRLGMSKLLSGICTGTSLYSVNILIMNGPNVPVLDEKTFLTWFESLDASLKDGAYAGYPGYFHPASIVGVLAAALIMKLLIDFLLSSEFGVMLRGVGQNESAARYYQRKPAAYKLAGLAVANASAAISGALMAQYQGFSSVSMGAGVLVLGLVAVILGQEIFSRAGLSLNSAKSVTRAALVGVVLYQLIFAAVLRMGAPPTSLRLISGAALVAVIALRQRRKAVTFSW